MCNVYNIFKGNMKSKRFPKQTWVWGSEKVLLCVFNLGPDNYGKLFTHKKLVEACVGARKHLLTFFPPLPLFCEQNLQNMDERRTVKLGETYRSFAEAERRVVPIISKCLEGMVVAAKAVDERRVRGEEKKSLHHQKAPAHLTCVFLLPGFNHSGGII